MTSNACAALRRCASVATSAVPRLYPEFPENFPDRASFPAKFAFRTVNVTSALYRVSGAMEYLQYMGPASMCLAALSVFALIGLNLKKSR